MRKRKTPSRVNSYATDLYLLYVIVFLSGAAVMVLELLGSRIVAPHYGTTLYAWASIISVILLSLSIGYYLGGRLADKRPSLGVLCSALFVAGLLVALIPFLEMLFVLSGLKFETKYGGLFLSILLFALPALLLGFVSPYSIKLASKSVKNVGSVAGNLYALSTLGSIFGTLAAGFWFVPSFGVDTIIYGISALLVLLSLPGLKQKLLFGPFSFFFIFTIYLIFSSPLPYPMVFEKDTAYYLVRIVDNPQKGSRSMFLDSSVSGGMYLNSSEHLYNYTDISRLAYLIKRPEKILIVGLGPGTQLKDARISFPNASVDVVEIDSAQVEIDEDYFNVVRDEKTKFFTEDARAYLANSEIIYDVLLIDAFNTVYSIPFHLTTKESVKLYYDNLAEDGVVSVNLISAVEGEKSAPFRTFYATYSSVFPTIYVFPSLPGHPEKVQNIILIGCKNSSKMSKPDFMSLAYSEGDASARRWAPAFLDKPINTSDVTILTDDYSPVENLMAPLCD